MRSVFIFVFLLASGAHAQTSLVGRILDSVTCAKDATQTYALYVPSSYDAKKAWPVIFCFDPGARGREPVERLHAAAEKYGYIVAGSLTSRNGPWAANVTAIQAMVGDVDSHLRIDPKRVYTAGLSGGARVATQLALAGFSKGVIACSAGFPQSDEGMPPKIPFVFFGTTGTEDFNYREMRRLDDELDARDAVHRIVVFDGGHEWASADVLASGVEWLELQAMRAGTRPRDEAMIKSAWETRRAALPAAATGGEAWRARKELAADFRGLVEVAELDSKAKELGATAEVKAWRKAERDLVAREDSLAGELVDAVQNSPAAMRKQVAALRALGDAPADSPERRMARRVLAGTMTFVRENTRAMLEAGDGMGAAPLLEAAVVLRPDQSRNYFDLARARAMDGDKRRALEALAQAAEKGFSDAARVESEKAFVKLKDDPAFQAALAKIRASPPSAPAPTSRERP